MFKFKKISTQIAVLCSTGKNLQKVLIKNVNPFNGCYPCNLYNSLRAQCSNTRLKVCTRIFCCCRAMSLNYSCIARYHKKVVDFTDFIEIFQKKFISERVIRVMKKTECSALLNVKNQEKYNKSHVHRNRGVLEFDFSLFHFDLAVLI